MVVDGLSSVEERSSTFSGTTAQFSTLAVGDGEIGNAELADSAASGTKVSTEFAPVYAGSPIAGGLTIQAGSAIASDDVVDVAFGEAFAGIPRVVITPAESGTLANASYIGSTVADGFIFFGQSGLAHNWMAIGSGRV